MGDRIVVMKGGFIQQVGTPQDLYYSPCNIFVASFIGSPPMNFINGTLMCSEKKYYITFDFQENFYEIRLPEDKIREQLIKKYIGKKVVMGIRPENVFVDDSSVSRFSADTITCHVDVTEVIGADSFLHLTCRNTLIVARTSSHTQICPGDIIKVQMDGNQIHIFDKKTGKAIL